MQEKKLTETEQVDFLQHHSGCYLEMALRSNRHERIENPDGYGKKSRGCGDTLEMFLMVRKKRIQSVSFVIDGCMHTNACANTVAHLTEGQAIAQAIEIKPQDIIDYLETLPPHENHCAELAVEAFQQALADYFENQKAPWKKVYKKR